MIKNLSLGILTCLLMGFSAGAADLTIFTEELPPLNMLDPRSKKPSGFSVEIVEALIRETRIHPVGGEIKLYPWARAYRLAQTQKNIMLFSMTRTEERDKLFKWVGPIAPRTVWLWKMKHRKDIAIESLEDTKPYIIGGVIDFAISEILLKKGYNVDMNTNINSNWRKLFLDRIDLGTALELEAGYYMRKHGRNFSELERLIKIEDRYKFYIALSLLTEDTIVHQLQSALDRMKTSGHYQSIWNKYLH